jgi:glycerol-3-phosphate acyltransferase PlsX
MHAIALDAMGGDNAPGAEVEGAIAAVREADVRVVLVGDEAMLTEELRRREYQGDALSVRHASEVVSMADNPGKVFRKKTDSSMRVATDLVVAGEVDGMVSAGNSGAVLSHCLFLLKRLPGVERPAIVQVFPTPDSQVTVCDLGANVDVRASMLAQFGVLGAAYDRILHGNERPRVAVLSNGEEASKGTDLTRRASEILEKAAAHPEAEFEFCGYIEGSHLFDNQVDVVATDGFTGNVVLKVSEGVSEALLRMIRTALTSTARSKMGALLAKPALAQLSEKLHYSEYGGAMLLGINGTVTICHGRSNARAIKNAILATDRFLRKGLREQLSRAIERHRDLWQTVKDEEQ